MIAATLLAASFGASVVISNDDWPVPGKDNLDTCSLEAAGSGWFAEYHMLTTIDCGRVDVAEAGYLWPGLPLGAYAQLSGNLGGRWAQSHWHASTGGGTPDLGWGCYDGGRVDAGLWIHETAGPVTVDARLASHSAYARADAAWSIDWADCTWTGGAFVRSWWHVDPNETAAEVHRQLGRVGICGRVTVAGSVISLQFAKDDVRGGIGWMF